MNLKHKIEFFKKLTKEHLIYDSMYIEFRASLVAQLVKNPPAMQETLVRSMGWEDPLGKG